MECLIRTLKCAIRILIYTHLVCIYLINIPEQVQYEIYTLAFPFDLGCESGKATYTPR